MGSGFDNLLFQEKESLDINTQEKIEAAGKKEEENVLFLRDMRRYAVMHILACESFSFCFPIPCDLLVFVYAGC